jgi:hypothetical protein
MIEEGAEVRGEIGKGVVPALVGIISIWIK